MGINTIAISGRLVADPELRYTAGGSAVATGRIAVDDGYGENKKTYFFEYSAWASTAEYMAKYASKGMPVTIHGKLVQNTWRNQDDEFRSKIEVRIYEVVLPPKPVRDSMATQEEYPMYGEEITFDDQDLPF